MAETNSALIARINRLTTAGHRGNLAARGLARGLVWRDGVLPPDAPTFSQDLTTDLLDQGFQLLSAALSLRAAEGDREAVRHGLRAAAESLESASRHDSQAVVERGFHLTMAAAAFHIGGYVARAYSLFEGSLSAFNLSSYETALVQLMRRDLSGLRGTFVAWLSDETNSDEGVLRRLQEESPADGDEDFGADDVVAMALTRHFHRAIATFEHALVAGIERYYLRALEMFFRGEQASSEAKHVPLWWSFQVARHLCDDLWGNSLRVVFPRRWGTTPVEGIARAIHPDLYFPQLPHLTHDRPGKSLRPSRGRRGGAGVAKSRPSSHDDGCHTEPCFRGTGHVILTPTPLAVRRFCPLRCLA